MNKNTWKENYLLKNFVRNTRVLLAFFIFLILLYFFTRFINLLKLPIFTDEAIYLRWAQIALNDPNYRFISLTDGKQPLFIWLVVLIMRYITFDPLLSGRIVSVIAGFLGMVGMFCLTGFLFKNLKTGVMAAFLYVISPFALFYDKIALYDSLTAMFFIWGLFFTVLFIKTERLDVGLILGMVMGAGILTKTSLFFLLAIMPFSLILFNWQRPFILRLIKVIAVALASVAISLGIYGILRLSPWFYIIGRKNEEFVYSFSEWLNNPWKHFLPNLYGLTQWLVSYLTMPLLIALFLSIFSIQKFWREKLFLTISFLMPFIYLSFFGKVLFPRFLLFMSMPLYVLIAVFLNNIIGKLICVDLKWKKVILFLFSFVSLFGIVIYMDYGIIFDHQRAFLPKTERNQYFDDWPSGYGVAEAVELLKRFSKEKDILVATEGTFGLFPAALDLYFYNDPHVETVGYWPVGSDTIEELREEAAKKDTYIIFKETQKIPEEWPLELVFEKPRGRGKTFFRMYKLIP